MTNCPGPEQPEPLASRTQRALRALLSRGSVSVDFGAFSVRLKSSLPEATATLLRAYPNHLSSAGQGFADTTIELLPGTGIRRWVRAQARIEIDGINPFGTFPREQLFPHLEWAVNWAFASMMNARLILHSGTVEIDGKAVLLIAKPGSGKSTLTAGLVARGARLLSDEFGVVRTSDGRLIPMAKPIALKNRSIETIRQWSPETVIGPTFVNTRKGNLAHMVVPSDSASAVGRPATPRLIIFPEWKEGSGCSLIPVAPARAFMEIAANSFNYEILGAAGFENVARLVETCRCFRFQYGTLEEAVSTVRRLCTATSEHEFNAELLG